MEHNHSHSSALPIEPVCGRAVIPEKAAGKSELNGTTYYFCSSGCKKKFDANPAAYLGEAPAPKPAAPPGTIYTCPMHPEVRQEGPGTCPKCGMALEPRQLCDHREQQVQLRVLFHFGLHEKYALRGIESRCHPVRGRVEGRLADLRRIGVVGRQRVPVRDEEETGILLLQPHPVADGAEVIAEMHTARWTEAAENVLRLWIH